MMAKAQSGRFITLEGGEGTGKSTQIVGLAKRLEEAGVDVITTREPGGAPGADTIRSILVSGETDRWDPMSEALLNFAARREHLIRTIWPALQRGHWVLSDRFADSTMAYQGYGHGVDRELIAALYRAAVGDFHPDLTIVLDLPVTEGLRRANQRNGAADAAEDRYERMDVAFHERLRAGFLAIAEAEPDRCLVIDGGGEPDDVAARIWAAVASKFAGDISTFGGAGD
ncbi:MAG: dTMP kinase [Alphaproteobacteria bacterium]|nr:dTMP kinase [Alphaproteobacteria bacterium]